MRALSQAGSELLGPGSCELVVLDTGKRNPLWILALGTNKPQTKVITTLSKTRPQPSPSHDASRRPWSSQVPAPPRLPRLPHSLQHPEGHHVWKHVCQALGSHVADAVIVQAAGDSGQGRGQGCWGVRAQAEPHLAGITAPFNRGGN